MQLPHTICCAHALWKRWPGMLSEQREALVKQEKELFDKSDKDKDGKLSMAEVKDMLYPDLKEHNFSGMQAATLMEMVDADKDKALSVEEMNKQHEKTVAFLMVHEKQGEGDGGEKATPQRQEL